MKTIILVGMIAFAPVGFAQAAVPACDKAQTASLPEAEQVHDHMPFTRQVIAYPFGSRKAYGFDLEYVVDADGHVTCADIADQIDPADYTRPSSGNPKPPIDITPQRQAALDQTVAASFKPFVVEGHAAAVYVDEFVREEQRPKYHVPPPQGDLASMHIHQTWQADMISGGASYDVHLYGDGRVIYQGIDGGPFGRQTYDIGKPAMQALLDKAAAIDFWSYDDDALASPVMLVHSSLLATTIEFGGHSNRLGYKSGLYGGEPQALRDLQRAIIAAAHIDWWNELPPEAMTHLETTGFDFHGKPGADLLMWALNKGRPDGIADATVERIIADGAPADHYVLNTYNGQVDGPLMTGLSAGRLRLAKDFIAHGALLKAGKPDRARINSAFIAALDGGYMEGVQLILPYNPDMTGPDIIVGKKRVSVLFWLARGGDKPDAAALTELLLQRGARVDARDAENQSILSFAAETAQIEVVRVLLKHGASPDALDQDDEPPLAATWKEDVALVLLEAGANPRKLNGGFDEEFAENITSNRWTRVRAWLTAHGYGDWLAAMAARSATP